jgi:signal transduction histidine kinase
MTRLERPSMTEFTSPGVSVGDRDGDLDRRVREARTELLYRRSQMVNWAGAGFALLLAVGLLPYVSAAGVWAWVALRFLVSAARLALNLQYRASDDQGRPFWDHAFVAGLGVDGFAWAVIGLWVIPLDLPTISVLMLTAIVGVASVGIFVLQSSFRASATFVISMLVPLVLLALWMGDRSGRFVGAGLSLYIVLLLIETRYSERRIDELLRLRFVTDRIAEERAEALRLAQRQGVVKDQFLATMSHELRTPLHGILGLTRALREQQPDTPQLALVERAGEHLLRLINDALDFSKLEAGHVHLVPQPFDLTALIDDVVSLSVLPASEAGLLLETRLHLPRPCLVVGDPARLRQILHNLVGNAVKFTETGRITVVAKHNAEAGRARIAVHDTGVGIAPEHLSVIFDAFHQADGTFTRRFAGTGLGLTIARELARAMGGDLLVTSQVGKGSVFTLKLDLPHPPVDLPLGEAPSPPPPSPRALGGRVLLAEDNPVNALVAEALLQKLGIDVTVVEDGAQAVEAFRSGRPDLVLLDCQMPVMDGLEAARRIRTLEATEGWPRTPMVALTANAFEGDRAESLAAGMDDHLAKPFKDEDLARVLARYLPER